MKSLNSLLKERVFESFHALDYAETKSWYVSGLEGSSLSALISARYSELEETGTSVLVIMKDAKSAEMLLEDLRGWLGEAEVLSFPGLGLKPYEWRSPFGQIIEQRLQCYGHVLKNSRCLLVTTLSAFLQKLNSPDFVRREIVTLEKGHELALDDLRDTLIHMGFTEESIVEEMGQFSVRGGILDIYPYLVDNPARIELWGDEIESIREFDIFSQRSAAELEAIEVFPFDENCFSQTELEEGLLSLGESITDESVFEAEIHRLVDKRDRTGLTWQRPFFSKHACSLLEFMGASPFIVMDGKDSLSRDIQEFMDAMDRGYEQACEREFLAAAPSELFFSRRDIETMLENCHTLYLGELAAEAPGYSSFHISEQTRGGGNLNSIQHVLDELRRRDFRIYISSPNQGQAERLKRLTRDLPVSDIIVGGLSSGFISHKDQVALFTDHQIFNRFSRGTAPRKFRGGGVSIPNFEALNRNDFVVHQEYGIGTFLGIKRIKIEDHYMDCILLQYHGNDKLTIPVSDLKKIYKYASREGAVPKLSRLGGKAWDQLKKRTRKSVIKLARDLIELYARRLAVKGFSFHPDSRLQNEFEEEFVFPPTPDQMKAIRDTKQDMQKPVPMDRLICGDVGFGKTEVAMRAAFKAVLDKKQVALLAPTTVLVSQHYSSFQERFSNWPASIDFLNRFKSVREQKKTLEDIRQGRVDIIIGTHRLISRDLIFKDLGLIIVDEEQKFGVKQKEKLKKMRTEVDVISMSATPIPRSLHMSMIGARDFSIIMTPPRNRLPIDTRVMEYDRKTVKEALERELERGGQCFFVHNRVMNLPEMTEEIEQLVPHARVGMAHGQMNEKDLEQVMYAFIHREYDILVSTSIIESGIDLPNVNTIIIHKAHKFGLSQLFQLRGRVGRSSTQAFCLLIAPEKEKFSDEAKKRLYSLQRFTELGSGYQLAMRDLEIRGAGNILGVQQSGHITALGFDTYCNLLKEAVRELQDRKELPPLDPEIDYPESAFIPEEYVEDGLQRIALYQKVSRCEGIEEVEGLHEELKDRFGPVPRSTVVLLQTMIIRILAQKLGFQKVVLRNQKMHLFYSEIHQPEPGALPDIMSKITRPFRFLNETPLQIVMELDKEESRGQIEQAVRELKCLA
ncbi:transcription-repair coupling factor [Fibrobacterota bacterium]